MIRIGQDYFQKVHQKSMVHKLQGPWKEVLLILLINRVGFFGPLFEFFDSSIFQGVRILKILAPGQKNFNLLHPGRSWVRSCVPGVPDHLGTPQRSHMGLKLKICYKNDILQAFFVL